MNQDTSFDAPPIALGHFQALTGPYGLYQHANKREPNLAEGYCTDDNARAVQVLLHLKQLKAADEAVVDHLLERCWNFLQEAQTANGHFWNFRDVQGTWLEQGRTGDMIARMVRVLVTVLTIDADTDRKNRAAVMLERLLPHITDLDAPRSWAEVAIALAALPSSYHDRYQVQSLMMKGRIYVQSLWKKHATPSWPWFEDQLTYANAIIPHGLLKDTESNGDMLRESTHFLIKTTIHKNIFVPVGNHGWYTKGGLFPFYDQQPIEAATMTDFLVDYAQAFPETIAPDSMATPYLWFFGANTQQALLVDVATGASCDGLNSPTGKPYAGRNLNRGAESLLAYLWTEIRMHHAPPTIQQYAWAKRTELLSKTADAESPT